jgi:hypothetical protein
MQQPATSALQRVTRNAQHTASSPVNRQPPKGADTFEALHLCP